MIINDTENQYTFLVLRIAGPPSEAVVDARDGGRRPVNFR
jgi:hypothetical protein